MQNFHPKEIIYQFILFVVDFKMAPKSNYQTLIILNRIVNSIQYSYKQSKAVIHLMNSIMQEQFIFI
jgi:hypothetical protein